MSAAALLLVLMAATRPAGVPCPLEQTLAYSRETLPGIPSGGHVDRPGPAPIATSYFVYLVAAKGCPPVVTGVCVKGAYHAATIHKVASPVRVPRDAAVPTGETIVLVPATASDVYEVRLGDEVPWSTANDRERRLARDNELVVFLKVDGTCSACAVRSFDPLPATAGQ